MKKLSLDGEKFLINLSFDINDFIGDGVWWLQIYDSERNLLYDKPYASSQGKPDYKIMTTLVRNELITNGSVER